MCQLVTLGLFVGVWLGFAVQAYQHLPPRPALFGTAVSMDVSSEVKPQLVSLVQRFQPAEFHPYPFFGRNPHWQTIVGTGALSSIVFGPPARTFDVVEEQIEAPDGDFFDVEFTPNAESADALVLILHGLESNTKGSLVTQFASALLSKGFACGLVSFRGCSGKVHRTYTGYHLGFTSDLDHLVSVINKRRPLQKIYLCGFSLGGNVILKFLGEQGQNALLRNIRGAAVTCVPFNPKGCQTKIDVGFSRAVYSENFLKTIKAKAEEQILQWPGIFDIEKVRSCRTIGEIDDYYISPVYGFKDKFDYYEKCGSIGFLSRIGVPAVAVNALDDPFIDASSLPTDADVNGAPVRLVYHPFGGHCGFAAGTKAEVTWLADELSRILHYFHDNFPQL